MILVKKKPYSPGSRGQLILKRDEVTYQGRPEKRLTKKYDSSFGLSNGVRTCRTKKRSKNRRILRIIDWKRDCLLPGTVERIEIDPIRSANIALINYPSGEKKYILAPKGLNIGQTIKRANDILPEVGNAMELKFIPVGTIIHCIEIRPNQGAKMCRSAGTYAKVLAQTENNYTKIELSSGEIKLIFNKCIAIIGSVGNIAWNKQKIGKAGKHMSFGRKPIVRGTAMNVVDHPHGGGEGKQPIGRKSPVNKNGKSMFALTRKRNKIGSKFILTSARSIRITKKAGKR